jgi:hypothetical protein
MLITILTLTLALAGCKKTESAPPPPPQEPQSQQEEAPPAEAAASAQPQMTAAEESVPEEAGTIGVPFSLPKPMFVGTPQNFTVKNLEPLLGKPRPPFPVPTGTTNVAAGKPISASDEEPIIGELEMITDGDKEAADGSYVELGPFLQHVTIDLQDEYEIYAVVLWHYHKQARVYFDVVVQIADDPDFITNVTTIFNNDDDNSAGLGTGTDMNYVETSEGKLVDAKGVSGRYVRCYSNGNSSNDLNNYIEVEVYGKPLNQ